MTGDYIATYAIPLKPCYCAVHIPCHVFISKITETFHNKTSQTCSECTYVRTARHDIPGCGDHGGLQLAVQVALHCLLCTEQLCPERASTPTSTTCCTTPLHWGVALQHIRQSPGVRRFHKQVFERVVTRGPPKTVLPRYLKPKAQESNIYAKESCQTA